MRTAIVTGGAGAGIGHGITEALVADGWAVLVVDRDRRTATSLAKRLQAQGYVIEILIADLTVLSTPRRVVQAAIKTFGRIDGLVNNAGVGLCKPIAEVTDAEFNRLLDVDLRSAFRMAREVIPAMSPSGGSIVNIGSVHAHKTIDHPLHKPPLGANKGWTQQFDEISKTIIQIELDNGAVGLGESYRGLAQENLRLIASKLIGQELNALNLQDLPLPPGRIYDGFECGLVDAMCRSKEVPLWRWLGGKYRNHVLCAYWTGHRTPQDAERKAREAFALGFAHIKFKCNLQDDVAAWCKRIMDACGDGMAVILDPNERFEYPSDAEKIARKVAEVVPRRSDPTLEHRCVGLSASQSFGSAFDAHLASLC